MIHEGNLWSYGQRLLRLRSRRELEGYRSAWAWWERGAWYRYQRSRLVRPTPCIRNRETLVESYGWITAATCFDKVDFVIMADFAL